MNFILIIGITSVLIGLLFYFLNVLLIRFFINKKIPGLIEVDMNLPEPRRSEEYLWEKTSGAGVVPKWVSLVGLLSYPIIFVGVILLFFSLIKYIISKVG